MMKNSFSWKYLVMLMVIVLCTRCRVPYEPDVISTETGYLVVEGFIDGGDATTILLSRTRTLSDTALPVPVTGAQVSVEDDHNDSYPLYESVNGNYSIDNLSLNISYKYRLHIFTADGKEYTSDYVPVKIAPPIDSVNWVFKDGGVQVYANTHDQQNTTPYFRWEYTETWEVHSEYQSAFQYYANYFGSLDTVRHRDPAKPIFKCWPTDKSSEIIIGSTAKLKNNVIYEQPLTYIADHDSRLSVLYSIEVKQYALDSTGYNFWLALKSNTEQIGSIFDPQPSNVVGNIHCITKPSETVIGYVGAGISTKERIYISNKSMPDDWNPVPNCDFREVPDIKDSLQFYFGTGRYTPISMGIGYYTAAYSTCVDCTLFGTNIKPDFWP